MLCGNNALTKNESTYGKITVVVTYCDFYIGKNGKQYLLPIIIGNSVSVNNLLGLSKFFSWKIVLGVKKEYVIFDVINILFLIVFQ